MTRLFPRVILLACAILGALAFAGRADAGLRPHLSSGTAQFISASDFVGSGKATHLGRYTEAGSVAFTPTGNPAVLHVEGTITYTASNGDELHALVSGELNSATGVVTATLTYCGGTERFANATGSATLTGQSSPTGAMTVTVVGTIDY